MLHLYFVKYLIDWSKGDKKKKKKTCTQEDGMKLTKFSLITVYNVETVN